MKFVAHRGGALAFGATRLNRGAAAPQRERLERHRRPGDVRARPRAPRAACRGCSRSGSGTARACRGPAGATSRLVGLQTPPSTYSRPPIATGANSHGTVHDASTASATRGVRRARAAEHDAAAAAAVDGRRPAAGRRTARLEPLDARARRPASVSRRARGGRREHRRAARARRRAPPSPSASGANVAPARHRPALRPRARPRESRRRRRPVRGPRRRSEARASAPTVGGPARARWPATRCAATIDPAEVPTKYSQSRRSKPVPSSIPASTPIIQASPRTPPPPRTRTSGRVRTSRT